MTSTTLSIFVQPALSPCETAPLSGFKYCPQFKGEAYRMDGVSQMGKGVAGFKIRRKIQ